jgi:DNA polymerase-3 subunit alpha
VPAPETGQEVDVILPQDYPVTPRVRAAIKSFPGVVMVEDL